MGLFQSGYEKFEKRLPNDAGKVFVITGTTSGIGFIAAETVLNKSLSESVESFEKLKGLNVTYKILHLSAIKVTLGCKAIYCLSNNAEILAADVTITEDENEIQMQTNHLSHFLLTNELFPLIFAGSKEHGDARIVQHSSAARHMTPKNGSEETYFLKKERDGLLGGNDGDTGLMKGGRWYRYFQTKLAASVSMRCLHDKLVAASERNEACKNVTSLRAHPGVARTSIWDDLHEGGFIVHKIIPLFIRMMDSKENVKCGTLYGPRRGLMGKTANPNRPTAYEISPEAKVMLWRTS
ncbi:hypothetical protein FRACYDRAFT_229600 [Fragilariopsis cylindrus CCMP1102]|uniref:NAD(P)-binding protein n=1 Tax=Fragilariopsis cylindrus CCMP1102 TaxID=635003 RepID=A0A1E7EMV8_9STRA|nr:hypothetical protein FRACYDRAFT_229600 [Fragilariopsis cylindrus CCMP1102]|eukprot:OEU07177.1 hypothetical protein FRACYDRAFT_229600 [Fragilariopsis cylindrus CCMP1102]